VLYTIDRFWIVLIMILIKFVKMDNKMDNNTDVCEQTKYLKYSC